VIKHLRILAPLLAAAAFAAGCGDGSSSTDSAGSGSGYDYSAPAEQEAATPAATKPAAAKAKTVVEISGSAFQPQTLDIKVGDTVTFVNKDEIAHTATADGTFDSKTLEQGASFDFTATKAGKIDYVCLFHPGMTGTLNVAD
jgi:plastocyanin